MTRQDYKFVVGDIDKIIIDGGIMPVRNDPETKTKLRGEDICFLLEAKRRLNRVYDQLDGTVNFTRRIESSQASNAVSWLNQGASLFGRNHKVLKSLPSAGSMIRYNSNYSTTSFEAYFDILGSDELEPVSPIPYPGARVEAAPFRAAFRNFKKIKGSVVKIPLYGEGKYVSTGEILDKSGLVEDPFVGGHGISIRYRSYSWGGFLSEYEDVDEEDIPDNAYPHSYRTIDYPVVAKEEIYPEGGRKTPGYLKGCRCLCGTVWSVSMSVASFPEDLVTGTTFGDYSGILMLDDAWTSAEDGKFTALNCSSFNAYQLLNKICGFAHSSLWGKVSSAYSPDEHSWVDTVATITPKVRFGIAATDDCLREGFN